MAIPILLGKRHNIQKIIDIKPESFSPRPKIDSTLLLFTPKQNFFELDNAETLKRLLEYFLAKEEKCSKNHSIKFLKMLQGLLHHNIDLNLRPQNLDFDTYYKLAYEYENLIS